MKRISSLLILLAVAGCFSAGAEDVKVTVSVCAEVKAQASSKQVKEDNGRLALDTERIQLALNLCQPGQSVLLVADKEQDAFLSAPLILPRGVALYVGDKVTLYASRRASDYDVASGSCSKLNGKLHQCRPFLFSYQAALSSVNGDGTIDGQGSRKLFDLNKTWGQFGEEASRRHIEFHAPDLVSSYESQDYSVANVHLQDAAGGSLTLYKTIGFRGLNLNIDAPAQAGRTSGILLSNSPDAELSHLAIHVPDVALDLRASILGGTSKVKIDDVLIKGGKGISLGDDVYGSVSAITISNVKVENAERGLFLNLRGAQGGTMHDVHLQSVCVNGTVVASAEKTQENVLPLNRKITVDDVVLPGKGILDLQGLIANSSAVCDAKVTQYHSNASMLTDLVVFTKPGIRSKLTVDANGSGDFSSIQSAVQALPNNGGEIAIKPGTYREVVTIRKPNVRMHGIDPDPAKTVIVYDNTGPKNSGTFNSATFFVEADNVSIDQVTIANDAGSGKGQAVALAVTADRAIFRKVRILGAQDTLFAAAKYCYGDYGPCVPARQYFQDCYIEGNVDFTFGDSKAVFDHCELHGIAGKNVMYTAHGQHYAAQESGYVFDHCRLTADAKAENISLGRPWRPYATVVYLNTTIDAPVIAAGWTEWPRFGVPSLPTTYYAEYQSTGTGANAAMRQSTSHQLAEQEAAKWRAGKFLTGVDGWNPANSR